ncbi:MAG: hypothetical protein ACI9MC_002244 [Kiritimatiellia bacterium]|jgi:hypothetical protein
MRIALLPFLLFGCVTPLTPTLTSMAPDLVCNELREGTWVEVRGDQLAATVQEALNEAPTLRIPQLHLTRVGGLAESEVANASSYTPADTAVRYGNANTMSMLVDESTDIGPGLWDLQVINPDGNKATLSGALLVAGSPTLDNLDPAGLCRDAQSVEVTLHGNGFLHLADLWPTVQVAGKDMPVLRGVDCLPLAGDRDGEVCDGVVIELNPDGLPLGSIAVTIQNPEPAACGDESTVQLELLPPSTVESITPDTACRDGDVLTIIGTQFLPGTQVLIGGTPAAEVRVIDRQTLQVVLAPDTPVGAQNVQVLPPQGCPVMVDNAVYVTAPPLVFAVDPQAVWNGADLRVIAWVSDVLHDVDDVWIEDASNVRTNVTWTWQAEQPGRVDLVVPAGLTPGQFTVLLSQGDACPSLPSATIEVLADTEVALVSVDPSYAWRLGSTAIEVTSPSPAPDGFVGLQAPPRLFLVGPDGAPNTHMLIGVDLRDDTVTTAIVPVGLDEGAYDLLALNPDGAIGWLDDAIQVTNNQPPSVEGVAPASLPNRPATPIRITGTAFRDPKVELSCKQGGTVTRASATVTSSTSKIIEATVPADRFGAAVCVVEVHNSDATSVRWSALSITNPAQNLFPWKTGPTMNEARRAPASAAGRTNSVSRWVYAIGGDDGDSSTAKTSVEVAPIGLFGDLGAWRKLPRDMPSGRTLGDVARIGQFIYLVGGHDGTTALSTVWRAQILEPDRVPRFDELTVAGFDSDLDDGAWTYRISAIYTHAHVANPDGESLPSEPIRLDVPEGTQPILHWRPVEGAASYRVYRTKNADDLPGNETLLAEVTDPQFEDTGASEPDGTTLPLPHGSLGAWHAVSSLTTERESGCVGVAVDPEPDPARVWLYAAGGRDSGGTELRTIERVDIEIRGPAHHVFGTWKDAGVTLSQARYRCGGMSVGSRLHSVVDDDETWLFFAGGIASRKATGTVDVGRLGEDGDLLEWSTTTPLKPARAGFAKASASDYLYVFGGHQGGPSTSGASAYLETIPELKNWNSLGTSLSVARLLPGSAQESAVLIVVGGSTDSGAASRTVDWTNW